MKLSFKKITKLVFIIFLFFFLYQIGFGILPYLFPPKVSETFKSSFLLSSFYQEREGPDRIDLLENSVSGLEAKLNLITNATSSIDMAYHLIENDNSSLSILASLLEMSKKGVKVRLLIDHVGNRISKDTLSLLNEQTNIEIKEFNPISIAFPWTYNTRLHDKFMIIDNRMYLLGGRNIGDSYFATNSYEKDVYLDREFFVYNTKYLEDDTSSSIYALKDYFGVLWNFKESKNIFNKNLDSAKKEDLTKTLKDAYAKAVQKYPKSFLQSLNYLENTIATNKITLLTNPVKLGNKEPTIWYPISEFLKSAKEKVIIQSPYIVANSSMMEDLENINAKKYEMLTNSTASATNTAAYSGYLAQRKKLATSTNSNLFEYQGKDSLHGKAFLIEDSISIVGSFNLDPRSTYIDTESMLVVQSTEFQKELEEAINHYEKQSLLVNTKGNYEDSSIIFKREIPFKKSAIYTFSPFFFSCFQFLL